jgi:hypothetical protein
MAGSAKRVPLVEGAGVTGVVRGTGWVGVAARGAGGVGVAARDAGGVSVAARGAGGIDGAARGADEVDGAVRGAGMVDGAGEGWVPRSDSRRESRSVGPGRNRQGETHLRRRRHDER